MNEKEKPTGEPKEDNPIRIEPPKGPRRRPNPNPLGPERLIIEEDLPPRRDTGKNNPKKEDNSANQNIKDEWWKF